MTYQFIAMHSNEYFRCAHVFGAGDFCEWTLRLAQARTKSAQSRRCVPCRNDRGSVPTVSQFETKNAIYNSQFQYTRWGAVSLDSEWSIPMFRADFLCFASKIVEHSRYLLVDSKGE